MIAEAALFSLSLSLSPGVRALGPSPSLPPSARDGGVNVVVRVMMAA
jgi:hypothetical protein